MSNAEFEERLLGAARLGLSPSAADSARVLASLESTIDAGQSPSHETSPTDLAPTSASASGWLAKGAVLLAVAAGAGSAGYAAGRRSALEERITPASVASVGPPVTPVRPPESPLEPRPISEPEPPARQPLPARAPSAAPSIATLPAPVDSADVGEELRTLRRVERALRAGNQQLALALLEELDREVPQGSLLEERLAARVVASCEQTFGPSREALLASFLERYPRSVHVARVRASCSESKK